MTVSALQSESTSADDEVVRQRLVLSVTVLAAAVLAGGVLWHAHQQDASGGQERARLTAYDAAREPARLVITKAKMPAGVVSCPASQSVSLCWQARGANPEVLAQSARQALAGQAHDAAGSCLKGGLHRLCEVHATVAGSAVRVSVAPLGQGARAEFYLMPIGARVNPWPLGSTPTRLR